MSPRRQLVRAFLVAPLVAPLGYWLGLLVVGLARAAREQSEPSSVVYGAVQVLGYVLVFGAPVAYAAALAGGLPIYLALRRAGRLGRAPLLGAGTALGAIVALLLAPELRGDIVSVPFPPWAGAVLGLAAAEVFWRLHPPARAGPAA